MDKSALPLILAISTAIALLSQKISAPIWATGILRYPPASRWRAGRGGISRTRLSLVEHGEARVTQHGTYFFGIGRRGVVVQNHLRHGTRSIAHDQIDVDEDRERRLHELFFWFNHVVVTCKGAAAAVVRPMSTQVICRGKPRGKMQSKAESQPRKSASTR